MGVEPTIFALATRRSTTELHPQTKNLSVRVRLRVTVWAKKPKVFTKIVVGVPVSVIDVKDEFLIPPRRTLTAFRTLVRDSNLQ